MRSGRPQLRAPGSFSPLPLGTNDSSTTDLSRTRIKRVESWSSEETFAVSSLHVPKARAQGTPIYASFTSNNSTTSINTVASSASSTQNFSRPTPSTAVSAARSVASLHSPKDPSRNGPSPLTLPPSGSSMSISSAAGRHHARKHAATPGLFEPTLPSTSMSGLSHMGQPSPKLRPARPRELLASHIAAQATVIHHQSQQQSQPHQHQQQAHQDQQAHQGQQHARQRSQTVPILGNDYEAPPPTSKWRGGGPLSPPMLSLTEPSVPQESGFTTAMQGSQSASMVSLLGGGHKSVVSAAASVVSPRLALSSPNLATQPGVMHATQSVAAWSPPPPMLPPKSEERAAKPEKSKVKLFSRPGRIGTKGESREKPLPSPSKLGQALSNFQRGNFSTTSLETAGQPLYSLANSSTATIRAVDAPPAGPEVKEKERKHHYFLSRQKHKLREKDDYHLPLSSASSNSRPTDPSAPNSLYSFNIPVSPGHSGNSFKDLRHARGLRDKKRDDKHLDEGALSYSTNDWPGSSSGVSVAPGSSMYLPEPFDSTKYGLSSMTLDDAWPFLKAKLLVVFEGEDLRLPVEDFNRVVTMHIQYCKARRSLHVIIEDLRELLTTGFLSLDQNLRRTPEDKLISSLVDTWVFSFTAILPYMQAVFLPLDLEFSGNRSLLTAERAWEFWDGALSRSQRSLLVGDSRRNAPGRGSVFPELEVRRFVLLAFRDVVILPRYEPLKTMFSRLSLEFLPQSLASMAMGSLVTMPSPLHQGHLATGLATASPAESTNSFNFTGPGTTMSLDPSQASYNSSSTTLLGADSISNASGNGNRSRAISNVSFGSDNVGIRPYTPSSLHTLGKSGSVPMGKSSSLREQNVEDSKQVADMAGRMLQCMSVLASVGLATALPPPSASSSPLLGLDDGQRMVEELNKLLKLNWLGRGRTGRNRRGIVGGRVRRGTTKPSAREPPEF